MPPNPLTMASIEDLAICLANVITRYHEFKSQQQTNSSADATKIADSSNTALDDFAKTVIDGLVSLSHLAHLIKEIGKYEQALKDKSWFARFPSYYPPSKWHAHFHLILAAIYLIRDACNNKKAYENNPELQRVFKQDLVKLIVTLFQLKNGGKEFNFSPSIKDRLLKFIETEPSLEVNSLYALDKFGKADVEKLKGLIPKENALYYKIKAILLENDGWKLETFTKIEIQNLRNILINQQVLKSKLPIEKDPCLSFIEANEFSLCTTEAKVIGNIGFGMFGWGRVCDKSSNLARMLRELVFRREYDKKTSCLNEIELRQNLDALLNRFFQQQEPVNSVASTVGVAGSPVFTPVPQEETSLKPAPGGGGGMWSYFGY